MTWRHPSPTHPTELEALVDELRGDPRAVGRRLLEAALDGDIPFEDLVDAFWDLTDSFGVAFAVSAFHVGGRSPCVLAGPGPDDVQHVR